MKNYYLRDYKEKRFIIKWKPLLNINKTWLFYYFVFNDYLSDNKNNFIYEGSCKQIFLQL